MATNWEKALAPDVEWREAYAYVAEYTRTILTGYDGPDLTTGQLVERMWPKAPGDPGYQRQRLFKALMALAPRGLADCCHRGAERPRGHFGGKAGKVKPIVRPWLWHAPGERHFEAVMRPTCPHCGGEL